MDRGDWNARYAGGGLIWGAEPNRFLAAAFGQVAARGAALDLACGEGRNAIWLAARGWRVTAVDFSEVALERARRLAAVRGVEVDWRLEDATTFEPLEGAYQLVIVAYLHPPPAERRRVLAHAASALAPGGELFAVGHARRNRTEGTGGPRDPELLWDPVEIRAELAALGLPAERAEHVFRPVEAAGGMRRAIDALVRARRPPAGGFGRPLG